MAATQKSVHTPVKEQERKMSIIELARGVREGRITIKKIKKWNNGTYKLYLGKPQDYPDSYSIVPLSDSVLVIKFGTGEKRVLKRKNDAWVTIPKKYAKEQEGPVLVEWKDEKTLLVYLA